MLIQRSPWLQASLQMCLWDMVRLTASYAPPPQPPTPNQRAQPLWTCSIFPHKSSGTGSKALKLYISSFRSQSNFFPLNRKDWCLIFKKNFAFCSGIRDYYFLQAASFPRLAAFHLPLQSQSGPLTKWTEWFEHQRGFQAIFFAIYRAGLCLKMMPCAFIIVKHQSPHSQTQPWGRLCTCSHHRLEIGCGHQVFVGALAPVWHWRWDRDKPIAVENMPLLIEKPAELYLKMHIMAH